jgi:hypothetical protein
LLRLRTTIPTAPQHFRLASDVYKDSLGLALCSVQGLLVAGRAWARHLLVAGPGAALELPRRHPAAAAYELRWSRYRAALREWQQQHGPEEAPAPAPAPLQPPQQQEQQQQRQQQAAVPACLPAPAPRLLGVEPQHLRAAGEQQLREWCRQLGMAASFVTKGDVAKLRAEACCWLVRGEDASWADVRSPATLAVDGDEAGEFDSSDGDDSYMSGGAEEQEEAEAAAEAAEAAAAEDDGAQGQRWWIDAQRDEWEGAEEAARQEREQAEQRWEEQEQEQDWAAAAEAGQQEREAAAWTVAAGPFAQPLPPPLPPSWVRFRRDAAAQVAACMAAGGRGRRGPD